MGRRLEATTYEGNSLLEWPKEAGRLRTTINVVILSLTKYMPLRVKNFFLKLLGVKIGKDTAIGLGVQIDIFFPDRIRIGEESIIGYNSTILAHEVTNEEFRKGDVEIGNNVMIGANTTILPGVKIEDGAKVSANSLVNRDIEKGEFVGGVPIETIDKS